MNSTTGIYASGVTIVSDCHGFDPVSAIYLDNEFKQQGSYSPDMVKYLFDSINVPYNFFVVDADWIYDRREFFPQNLSDVKIDLNDKRNILIF